jgi:hypothetical protein
MNMSTTRAFLRLLTSPVQFRLFIFLRVPGAYFSGVRIKTASEDHCVVTIPYKWFTRNPFRSTYFASLSMAAEMSTGSLAMMHTYKRQPAVSLLVTKVEAVYSKKATGRSTFVCNDGAQFKAVIEKAVATGEAQTFTARSTGTNEAGEVVAEFWITWSFKVRKA